MDRNSPSPVENAEGKNSMINNNKKPFNQVRS